LLILIALVQIATTCSAGSPTCVTHNDDIPIGAASRPTCSRTASGTNFSFLPPLASDDIFELAISVNISSYPINVVENDVDPFQSSMAGVSRVIITQGLNAGFGSLEVNGVSMPEHAAASVRLTYASVLWRTLCNDRCYLCCLGSNELLLRV
jgi:hypothetical protein